MHMPLPSPVAGRPLLMISADAPAAARLELVLEAASRRIGALRLDTARSARSIDGAARACAADAIAVCGPGWMQARVAEVAAGRDLAFACVPCGAHDLLAGDLGVPAGDPAQSLVPLLEGSECPVDLGEVNGVAFVNYVAIGRCAGAGQPHLDPLGRDGPAEVLVTNNRFTLDGEHLLGRERLDAGLLGICVRPAAAEGEPAPTEASLAAHDACTQIELFAEGPVFAEVDGLPRVLTAPLRFRVLAGAVRALSPAGA